MMETIIFSDAAKLALWINNLTDDLSMDQLGVCRSYLRGLFVHQRHIDPTHEENIYHYAAGYELLMHQHIKKILRGLQVELSTKAAHALLGYLAQEAIDPNKVERFLRCIIPRKTYFIVSRTARYHGKSGRLKQHIRWK